MLSHRAGDQESAVKESARRAPSDVRWGELFLASSWQPVGAGAPWLAVASLHSALASVAFSPHACACVSLCLSSEDTGPVGPNTVWPPLN